jgi:hypothetical protein
VDVESLAEYTRKMKWQPHIILEALKLKSHHVGRSISPKLLV